jgi:ATP-dependent helicase/nuclease subunit A
VVGALFHEALRRWHFPDAAGFDGLMRLHAQEMGLTDAAEIRATVAQVDRLLRRFQDHALYQQTATACRYHETPYVTEREGQIRSRIIDLLFERNGRWTVVDFKTDRLRDEKDLQSPQIEKYREQIREYVTAVNEMLGVKAAGQLCFLDVGGRVRLEPVEAV